MNKVSITFSPSKKQVSVAQGTSILDAAREAGLHIQSVCGGDGVCGKCRVIIKKGKVDPVRDRSPQRDDRKSTTPTSRLVDDKTKGDISDRANGISNGVVSPPTGLLTPEEIDDDVVLACEAKVFEDINVEIPPESRADEGEILMGAKGAHKKFDLYSNVEELAPDIIHEAKILEHSPLATKIFLKLPPPTLDDIISDLERIYRALHKLGVDHIQTGLANLKNIGGFLRQHNWAITVTLGKRNGTTELIQMEGGDTSKTNYGVAVDIGTTTVVTHLVDLVSEQTVCSMGAFNKQITYGDDIISRIIFASEKEGLEKLHMAVVDNINSLIQGCIQDCCNKSKNIRLEDITCVLCAGNPTMTHLLLNIDPGYLRKEPYVPTTNEMPVIRAAEAGIKINHRGLLACAPGVSSYIGADITAGLLVSDLTEKPDVAMYIDMGTNGEIVLGNKDWLTCCACSVGPAFEGSGIRCGTRAIKGAIQKVKIPDPAQPAKAETIGDNQPNGICGSGLIELISEMLNAGIIDRAGKISRIPNPASRIIREGDEGLEYIVVPKDQSATGRDIVITQADIDHIIRSKAAVYAGMATLLKKMNYTVKDVSRFYIAGGFGSHLDIAKAITIGLLPNAPLDRFSYIGNGSVEGARMILLSYIAMAKARQVADKMTYIELSTDNTFTEEFISAMFLPHTDLSLFADR
ncbi:MAG: ASKHA domain-containing protein [Planctomycetota bacterium]